MYKFVVVLRYLRKRKITIFPMAGVALGVMALVVVLSVMEGFDTDFRRRIRGMSPDLSLDFKSVYGFGGSNEALADELVGRIESVKEVKAASPYVSGLALAVVWTPVPDDPFSMYVTSQYVNFRGFDFQCEENVLALTKHLKYGTDCFAAHPYDKEGAKAGAKAVFILGSRFAKREHPDVRTKETDWGTVDRGARTQLTTFTPDNEAAVLKGTVADIVSSGVYELDQHMLFMPLDWARAFRRLSPGTISGVGIALNDYTPETVASAKVHIAEAVADVAPTHTYQLISWEESRRTFLTALAMERRIMAFILFFFLVVAGFSNAAILIMIVLDKVRDIGILRAMGASARGVGGMFLVYGAAIGIVGALIGLMGGVVFVKNIDAVEAAVYAVTGWQPFPPELYDLPEIPRILNWWTNLYISVAAVAVSFLASLLPAVKASRLDPVEAIRYE
ncbi:MAG: ABC transporter permease [Planctomycetes bacterium]|nr:ABC transporter permease [Planctomycetota bacterium]